MNIVIFGWFGASKKNLEKYKNLFIDLGATNVYAHPSNIKQCVTYTGWKAMRNDPPVWANQTIDIAVIFSGGVFPYVNYRIARDDFKPQKLIFDSGIFFPTPGQTSHYLKHIVPSTCQRLFPTRLTNFFINTLWGVQQYNWKQRLNEFEHIICCTAEKLIINSKADPFIIRPELDDFLARYNGGKVSEFLFENSGHVQHFRAYPQQYKQLVREFVNGSR